MLNLIEKGQIEESGDAAQGVKRFKASDSNTHQGQSGDLVGQAS